jgi:UDPglucose 6-dehydrogenase
VGTPPDEDGSADLKYVLDVAREVGQNMENYLILVTKSTVPVGTAEKVKKVLKEELDKRGADIEFDVASNPEFLKEGAAVQDFLKPDRIVVGTESEKAQEIMSRLYKPFTLNGHPVIFMDIDVNMVRKGIGSDSRIGNKFIYPGTGYGGSCFPKDVKAIIRTARQNNYNLRVLQAVEDVNEDQKSILFEKLMKYYNGDIKGKKIAMWGLSFKPKTDDMNLIDKITEAGATIKAFDPVAMEEAKRRVGDKIEYAKDQYDALLDADALLLVTEWMDFRYPNFNVIKRLMKKHLVFDGRNIYDHMEMRKYGFDYYGIGIGDKN